MSMLQLQLALKPLEVNVQSKWRSAAVLILPTGRHLVVAAPVTHKAAVTYQLSMDVLKSVCC